MIVEILTAIGIIAGIIAAMTGGWLLYHWFSDKKPWLLG